MSDHTAEAQHVAEIITQYSYRDEKQRIQTAFGSKTTKGIADLVDRETNLKELQEIVTELLNIFGTQQTWTGPGWLQIHRNELLKRAQAAQDRAYAMAQTMEADDAPTV